MKKKNIIWTFLDDETQQAFYDLQRRVSDEGKMAIENEVLSKIDQKGKPVVGVTEITLDKAQFMIEGTFGRCSFPSALLKS